MDNGRMKRTLEFDITDIVGLRNALRIGANTAMMCTDPELEARLRAMQERLDAMIASDEEPIAYLETIFDGGDISGIGDAVQTNRVCIVTWRPVPWERGYTRRGHLCVDFPDGRTFQSKDIVDRDNVAIARLREAVDALAPCTFEAELVRPKEYF